MTILPPASPPLSVGSCATLASIWEATAAKPGNVHRGADFPDMTYAQFLTSAAIVGPILEQAPQRGVGATVLDAVKATRLAVDANTNLGMLLLMAPLAACGKQITQDRVAKILEQLSVEDTHLVYEAIEWARPGGLGEVDQADVNNPPPDIPLHEAMQLAADRDLVARQYCNNFAEVLERSSLIGLGLVGGMSINDIVVRAFLGLLSDEPDSLIARKCGHEMAAEVSRRATTVLALEDPQAYDAALADFDFWLRADGNRRNPGTTADLIAAALFVVLAQGNLGWPLKFYADPAS